MAQQFDWQKESLTKTVGVVVVIFERRNNVRIEKS